MKSIKTSTLEMRFQKLHNLFTYSSDCIKAIVFHSKRLLAINGSEELKMTITQFTCRVHEWCAQVEQLSQMCRNLELLYFGNRVDDNKCELIEVVPTYSSSEIPAIFQMAETLYKVGFYILEEDIYGVKNKTFTMLEILSDIEQLYSYAVFCVKALPNMKYQGVWSEIGVKACYVHDQFCTNFCEYKQDILSIMQKDCIVNSQV